MSITRPWRGCALRPMLLALSLTGCATTLPPPSACPTLPAPPAVSSPIPPESYSATAHWHISTWRSRLTATPPTSGSSSKDGRDEN